MFDYKDYKVAIQDNETEINLTIFNTTTCKTYKTTINEENKIDVNPISDLNKLYDLLISVFDKTLTHEYKLEFIHIEDKLKLDFKIDLKYFTIEFDLLLHERIIDYSIIHEELKKLTKRYNTLNLKYNKLLNNENIYTIYLFGQKLVNGCYINGLFFNSFNITKKHTRIYLSKESEYEYKDISDFNKCIEYGKSENDVFSGFNLIHDLDYLIINKLALEAKSLTNIHIKKLEINNKDCDFNYYNFNITVDTLIIRSSMNNFTRNFNNFNLKIKNDLIIYNFDALKTNNDLITYCKNNNIDLIFR